MYYWIIEQNLELQKLYKVFLISQGHKVECFLSTEAALQFLKSKNIKPDICVIDSPLQNEYHLSELIQKLDSFSQIIFSISDFEARVMLRGIPSIILEKPFRLKELLSS
ncbi:MAG: hypothetical protein ACFFCZ_15065 [Promethearchaeota archaeon]